MKADAYKANFDLDKEAVTDILRATLEHAKDNPKFKIELYCLIFFFWLHPIMTLDTLFLAVAATIYLYVGTYHQDLRGLRLIGKEWETTDSIRTCCCQPRKSSPG